MRAQSRPSGGGLTRRAFVAGLIASAGGLALAGLAPRVSTARPLPRSPAPPLSIRAEDVLTPAGVA